MNQSISFNGLGKGVSNFFHRYHVVIFIVLALGGLIVATLMLNATVGRSVAQPVTATGITFDKTTINKLDKLKTADEQTSGGAAPLGRRNPFVE